MATKCGVPLEWLRNCGLSVADEAQGDEALERVRLAFNRAFGLPCEAGTIGYEAAEAPNLMHHTRGPGTSTRQVDFETIRRSDALFSRYSLKACVFAARSRITP